MCRSFSRLLLSAGEMQSEFYTGRNAAAVLWFGRHFSTSVRKLAGGVRQSPVSSNSGGFGAYWDKMTRLERLVCRLSRSEVPPHHVRRAMFNLHRACSDGVQHKDFFHVCCMPDAFQSWFTVTHFHVYLCLDRLIQEGKVGQKFGMRYLLEIMWVHTENRMKEFAKEVVGGVRKSKALNEFYQQHLAMTDSYEYGLYSDDQTLAQVLFNNLFVEKQRMKTKNLALMVEYTRKSVIMLENVSSLHLLTDGTVKFPPLLPTTQNAHTSNR